jgi:AAA+ ATPase superfamily predicted ATPase
MLINREQELDELNFLLQEGGAHLLAVSGRRRLGKTTLLVEWARQSGHPYIYWVASRAPATLLLRQFSQLVWQHTYPDDVMPANFTYQEWSEVFTQLARLTSHQRMIIILDEFPYAVETDPSLPSVLQNAWDHHLKQTQAAVVICGSQVSMMEGLMRYEAPLFGRITGPLRVEPLAFKALKQFYSRYNSEQRIAVWSILGGVPAYLEKFNDHLTIGENVKRHIFRATGIFSTDPENLLHEALREPHNYIAVLLAIASGNHRVTDIASNAGLPQVDPYLSRLRELALIRREVPVTVPKVNWEASRLGRYVLADAYLRFYFRFIWPNQHLLEQRLYDVLWDLIGEQLRAYIGQTAFEELCQEWVLAQARRKQLPFIPERVGAHWGKGVQVDVAAINWRERKLLIGECKWGTHAVGRDVIRELIERKTPLVQAALPEGGNQWDIHHVFFARAGFTEAAQAKAREAMFVDLARLDEGLS